MKKHFLSLIMVLVGLLIGVNSAFATLADPETQGFWARLTAKAATTTTGTGTVSVNVEYVDEASAVYGSTSSADHYTEMYANLSASLTAKDAIFQSVYAKPDNGSYFVGWSYTDGNTDNFGEDNPPSSLALTPSATKGHANIRKYFIYAAFEKVRLVSYEITGDRTTAYVGGKWQCTQYVTFRAETPGNSWALSDGAEVNFNLPTIVRKDGTTGTWTQGVAEWIPDDNIALNGYFAELTVPVTFEAPDGDAGEYNATLTLSTPAGVAMNVYLSARTVVAGSQAFRYNKDKEFEAEGTLEAMLSGASDDDIIKLNADYSNAVSISKKVTFDLNGFTLNNTLTVSGSEVTLAHSPFDGNLTGNVNVTGGKLILNGGIITGDVNVSAGAVLEQNGAAITGSMTNAGTLTTTDGSLVGALSSSGTLTVNGGTFEHTENAITITGGTATIKKGTITANNYGVEATGGTTTIEKLAYIHSNSEKSLYANGGYITVNCGKFDAPYSLADGDITFVSGYFKEDGGETDVLGKQMWRNTSGAEYREGYNFFAGAQDAVYAAGVSVCHIGTTNFSKLEDALAYANNNPMQQLIIFMDNDYTLPAGIYTLPANATLVVPKSNDQKIVYPLVDHESASGAYPAPVEFRTLTFASGVQMNVLGQIELSGTQYCKTGAQEQSFPGGPYGHLVLKYGSHITLNAGSELRAWGYVSGDGVEKDGNTYLSGEIDARRGSIVREQFQMGDWKGGNISYTMINPDVEPQNKYSLFPVYSYFIQNVESPVRYHPGSALICATAVEVGMGVRAYADEIKVVGLLGEAAMFLMDPEADAENTWVRKWYDAYKDQQVYEINSGAQLGSMLINLGEMPKQYIKSGTPGTLEIVMDSRRFILPLTNNMKIHLLSGQMEFTQSTSCLPGMEVEIDKESTISVIKKAGVVSGALYFYDSDQWGQYVGGAAQKNPSKTTRHYGLIVPYSATLNAKPTYRDVSSAAALGDAKLIVHGTFRMAEGCAVYTSAGKMEVSNDGTNYVYKADLGSGGGHIVSTNEDAGTFIFENDAMPSNEIHVTQDGTVLTGIALNGEGKLNPDVLINYDNTTDGQSIPMTIGTDTKPVFGYQLFTSARLKNADNSLINTYTDADHHAVAKDAYCYINDRWRILKVDEDNECFMKDVADPLNPEFYAKPAEYVAIVATKDPVSKKITGNADHTFSDAAGTGRLFILMQNECQWWEVVNENNLYHCTHPQNNTYYYWQDEVRDEYDDIIEPAGWKEKRYTITWKNWNGDELETIGADGNPTTAYDVTYGTMAEYWGSNPTREADLDYTYDFVGWTPTLAPVTSDVTYTAVYTTKPVKYTVIFQQEGGMEIERQYLTHNEVPECQNVPTRTGFTLQWSPAIGAVTGESKTVTYTATWLPEPPTEYEIRFVDYNGTTILKGGDLDPYMVAVGATPDAPSEPSGKPATSEYTYEFDHWSPALAPVTQAMTYTAVYREVAKTYTISYYKEDGVTPNATKASEELTYGATPTPPAVTKESPVAGHTYTLVWKTLDESQGIQTVMGAASYKPTYIDVVNRYTVTLKTEGGAGCTFSGAGIYDYGTEITIQAHVKSGWNFVEWKEDHSTNPVRAGQTVTGDITWTAVIEEVPETNLVIEDEEDHELTENTEVTNFIIRSDGTTSGSLNVAGHTFNVTGDAWFELNTSIPARTWYAVAAPWRVNLAGGLCNASKTPLTVGVDFDLLEYNGYSRATAGAEHGSEEEREASWSYVTTAMQPGKLYMIFLANAQSGLHFKRAAGESLLNTSISLQNFGSGPYDNWNGIANPAVFRAWLNEGSGSHVAQKYAGDSYLAFDMSVNALIVGQPVFLQYVGMGAITANITKSGAGYAPRRKVTTTRYTVELSNNEKLCDRLFVATADEKENQYIIGKDVKKMAVATKVAQIWVDRYDVPLCLNTQEMTNDRAEYPLGIYAPADGEYTISAVESGENTALYLTVNGEAVWNLSDSPFTLTLSRGTTYQYGLRVSARTPQSTEGCDEIIADGVEGVRKALINDQVYIFRGNEVFTPQGQKVK